MAEVVVAEAEAEAAVEVAMAEVVAAEAAEAAVAVAAKAEVVAAGVTRQTVPPGLPAFVSFPACTSTRASMVPQP